MLVLRSLKFNQSGVGYSAGHFNGAFALARFNQDGSFDQAFGADGIVSNSSGVDADAINILKDGSIMMTGYGAGMSLTVAKYDAVGDLDANFGSDGFLNFNFFSNNVGQSIYELNNGNILICGVTNNATFFYGGLTGIGVAMIDHTGEMVQSFGQDGKLIIGDSMFPWWSFAASQNIKGVEKILIGGTETVADKTEFFICRLNEKGEFDSTFANNGKFVDNAVNNEQLTNFLVNSKNEIFLTGTIADTQKFFDLPGEFGQNANFYIKKLNSDGSICKTYGKGGVVETDFGGRDLSLASTLQADGKLILAGQSAQPPQSNYLDYNKLILARYDQTGKLDSTFGTGGKVTLNVNTSGMSWFEVTDLVFSQNKIYVCWTSGVTSTTVQFDIKGKLLSGKLIGNDGNDVFSGTAASDMLIGLDGNDNLNGGAGNDVLLGGAGDDVIDGGIGNNTANYSDTTSDVNVDLSSGVATGEGSDTLINIQNAVGGQGDDSIAGNSAANVLTGGVGDDDLIGGLGNDVLDGGVGFDCADYQTSQSNLTINLAKGTASGADIGVDKLIGIEEACAGSGNDSLTAANSASQLEGNAGNDTLTGGAGDDVLLGGSDSDGLLGGAANDTLDGGAGNDVLKGGAGNDALDGGDGVDTADYSDKTKAIELTLNGSTDATVKVNSVNEDTIKNIENLIGGSGNDILTGDSAANVLNGGAGNDSLKGGAGEDLLTGGKGADRFIFNDLISKDKVTDFKIADKDKLVFDPTAFENLRDGFATENLVVNNTGLAADANDYLIFNSSNKTLYYDADGSGNGAAVAVVELTGVNTLQASDFIIA